MVLSEGGALSEKLREMKLRGRIIRSYHVMGERIVLSGYNRIKKFNLTILSSSCSVCQTPRGPDSISLYIKSSLYCAPNAALGVNLIPPERYG